MGIRMTIDSDIGGTAGQHAVNFRSNAYTPTDLFETLNAKIISQNKNLNAFISFADEAALSAAENATQRIKSGEDGPLIGIPIAVKDLLNTAGQRTTAGSKMLENFIPVEDSTVVQKLKDAGLVIVGKTNLDEFAMGSSNEYSAYGQVHNPWDLSRVPGGSSGGSAATVAARGVPLSIGTDTGGSIRQPAALCGVMGLKPTYGRVSRFGVVAFASSLDQVGPFSRDANDMADLLQVIAGHDEKDSTSSHEPVPNFKSTFGQGFDGVKIGIPSELLQEGVEDNILELFEHAISEFEARGAIINRDISIPSIKAALPVYYLLAPSEASANLARYDGVKYGFSALDGKNAEEVMSASRGIAFGPEVKRRIMIGTYALSAGYYDAYYLKAQKVRTVIQEEFNTALNEVDTIFTPTTPTKAFEIGSKVNNPIEMYLNDLFTLPANIVGLPALSTPCGFSEGLPIGLQMIGKAFGEADLIGYAHAYQSVTDWHKSAPTDE